MTLTEIFIAFVCLVLTTYYGFKWYIINRRYKYWTNKGVFGFKTTFPGGNAGNILTVKQSFSELFAEKYFEIKAANARDAGFYFLFTPQYLPVDLEIIKSILLKDFNHFTDRGVYYNERDDPLSAHLFTIEGNRWRALRAKISPTFTSGKMKMMLSSMVGVVEEVLRLLRDRTANEPIEMKELMARFTTDIIGTCTFGIDCNSVKNPDTDFMKYGRRIFIESPIRKFINFLTFVFPNQMRFFGVRQLPKESTDFFMSVFKETIEFREANNVKRKDFMDLLLQLKRNGKLDDDNEQGEQQNDDLKNSTVLTDLTLEQIAGQAFVFFVAGFETSSSTLSFCLYELACNEDVQEKLRNEIENVLGRRRGKLSYEAISQMKYLDMILNETLRKYPSVPILNRVCTSDFRVPQTNVLLEKGTQVIISVEGLHNDPDYFPEPEKFDPERFNEENRRSIPSFAYLPFGDGPRLCIGMRFALLMLKVLILLLVKEFRLKINPKTPVPLVMDRTKFLKTSSGGIWLDLSNV